MHRVRFRSMMTMAVAAGMCLAALALAGAGAADEPAFKPIFNGKDLDGWEGDKDIWSVKDGAITGVTTDDKKLPYNKFLIWRGGKPKNFVLKAKVKLVGNSNSGIQYRSEVMKEGEFRVKGYQMDIHPSPNYNAMLYDEGGRGILAERGQKVVVDPKGEKHVIGKTDAPEPAKLDEWNDYEIEARNNHLIHKLNGKTTIEFLDLQEGEREFEGILAIQVHVGPAMTVSVKDIALKTLPDGGLIGPSDLEKFSKPQAKANAKGTAKRRAMPTGPAPPHTPPDKLKALKGFQVELVHAVPRDQEGSWVSMTLDPKNRLIVSDQYGGLYRVTPMPIGGKPEETKVEKIDVPIGEAQGLCWAFDSLYVVVNRGEKYDSGLYRLRDTNGDGDLDKVEQLLKIDGGGEHGPHGVALSPDKKSLYIVAGNGTTLPKVQSSVVSRHLSEDNLIPRMPDGAGFMRDEKAPGGFIVKTDPDGKNWELISSGYRNAYDLAFNRDGELFTYDSDMEWDMNLPWYRPTRVLHAVPGSEFGYRGGSGKWPTYDLDSLPAVVDIGPGSPTGIAFGYGAKFPAKYQDALFISDWSYGKLYALHLNPDGASYSADVEDFLEGSPLPLTDLVVNPTDGALYVAVGGRRTTSALYRVTYTGDLSTAPASYKDTGDRARATRHKLERFLGKAQPRAVDTVWPYLDHPDRFVRWPARLALEFQDAATWRERALNEPSPWKALPALLALIHVSALDPIHRMPGATGPDAGLKASILEALARVRGEELNEARTLDLLRVYEVFFARFGLPEVKAAQDLIAWLDERYPAKSEPMNAELATLMVALKAPNAAAKTVALLEKAPTQEEQIAYASDLRVLDNGWTPELRKRYLSWFQKAAGYHGGNSVPGFMRNIRVDATAHLSASEKAEYASLLDVKPPTGPLVAAASRPFKQTWTLDELVPLVESGLKSGKRDYDRGRSLFGGVSCYSCHRFNNEGGGAGPDLSGVSGRFSTRDLLESIVVPSKVISDQYGAVMVSTTDGKVVTGRIVNLNNNTMNINTNMLDPNLQVGIDRTKIEEVKPSPVSMMPEGLLNTLDKNEVLDLVAYLLSRGDRKNPVFH
jgi:putative heme-binding domain-containing protein